MNKFLRILLIIISTTLIIQLGTATLTNNQVYADVGNFKSYKSKGGSSSSKSSKTYKSKGSNSSSKKYKSNWNYKPYSSSSNSTYKSNDKSNYDSSSSSQNQATKKEDESKDILSYILPFFIANHFFTNFLGGNGRSNIGTGILGIAIIVIIIIAISKGKNK